MNIYDLSDEQAFSNFKSIFSKIIQSCNLNLLLGSGASMPAINTLGNIEEEVEKLFETTKKKEAHKKLISFLHNIFIANYKLLDSEDENTENTKSNYIDLIEIINSILINRENIEIGHKAINIFTTNYDMFLEYACDKSGKILHYNDGFRNKNAQFMYPQLDVSEFDKTVFCSSGLYDYQLELPKINIIKLHGSLNWEIKDTNLITYNNFVNFSKEIDNINKEDDNSIVTFLEKVGVIHPYHKKHKDTVINRVYYNLLRYFSNNLLKTHTVLIGLGFSFNDKHLFDIISHSLKTNPTLQLIIFAYDENSKKDMENKFNEFNNVSIIYNSEKEVTLNFFNSYTKSFMQELIKNC